MATVTLKSIVSPGTSSSVMVVRLATPHFSSPSRVPISPSASQSLGLSKRPWIGFINKAISGCS